MNKFYTGRVDTTFDGYGFVAIESVACMDGSEHDLKTTADIFVPAASCPDGKLCKGMRLRFSVTDDEKRGDGHLRTGSVALHGVDLHFSQTFVNHSSVPIHWCFDRAIVDEMREHPRMEYFLVVGAAQYTVQDGERIRNSRLASLEVFIGLDALKVARGYLEFYGGGDYDIFTYLVRSPHSAKEIRKKLKGMSARDFDPVDRYGRIQDDSWHDLPFLKSHDSDRSVGIGKVICVHQMKASVPSDIFAAPLPKWKQKWVGYFFNLDVIDECAERKKVWFSYMPGPILFLFWETFKRAYLTLLAIVHFLIGGKPQVLLRRALAGKLSASLPSHWNGKWEYEPLMDYAGGWKFFLRPAFPIFGICLLVLMIMYDSVLTIGIRGGGLLAIVTLGGWLFNRYYDAIEARLAEASANAEADRIENRLSQIETYALCGPRKPKGPLTATLVFKGVKQLVCRNHNRS